MNPPDEDEVARRMPAWLALAELFLDTELQSEDYARIRAALRGSGFTAGRLRAMLEREVAPVLCHNLLAVAGEWAFWDEADMRRLILPRLRAASDHPRPSLLVRLLFRRYLADEWAKIDPAVS